MIHGVGNPKFYIYDSTGVTLQTIPTNLGSSGCIQLSKNVVVNEFEPDRYDVVNESPITRTELREFLGYKYKASISVAMGDYFPSVPFRSSTGVDQRLLQYVADQATTNVNDIYKLRAIEAYANSGYKIKFTPHSDTEDLWGSQFPIWVDLKITKSAKVNRIYSDSMVMEIHGTELISTPYPFTAYSITTSSGVANANQCLELNGTDESGTFTATNCGKTYSVEMWIKSSDTNGVILNNGAGGGSLQVDSTKIYAAADGSTQAEATVSVLDGVSHHIVITRNNSVTINFYVDGAFIESSVIDTNADWTPATFGMRTGGTIYYAGKIRALRCYTTKITADQVKRQYNNGYGNWPLDIAANFIWEFDGTGGTGTTSETDQSGNGKTLTLANAPTRTTW